MKILDAPELAELTRQLSSIREQLEPLLQQLEALQQTCSTAIRGMNEQWRALIDDPRFRQGMRETDDLLALVCEWRSDQERIAAAERVAARLGRFIHPKRWPAILPALQAEAKTRGTSPKAVRLEKTVNALFAEAEAALPASNLGEAYRILRTRLNKIVTVDVLGLDWRRETTEVDPDILSDDRRALNRIEAKIEASQLIARVNLAPLEAQVMRRHIQGVQSTETADELGKADATIRSSLSRARKNLRKSPDLRKRLLLLRGY